MILTNIYKNIKKQLQIVIMLQNQLLTEEFQILISDVIPYAIAPTHPHRHTEDIPSSSHPYVMVSFFRDDLINCSYQSINHVLVYCTSLKYLSLLYKWLTLSTKSSCFQTFLLSMQGWPWLRQIWNWSFIINLDSGQICSFFPLYASFFVCGSLFFSILII